MTIRVRSNRDPSHVTPAPLQVAVLCLVEGDDQHAAVRTGEVRAGQQWRDVRLQPRIGLRQRTVVRIVQQIRDNERVVRQVVVGNVLGFSTGEWTRSSPLALRYLAAGNLAETIMGRVNGKSSCVLRGSTSATCSPLIASARACESSRHRR